MRDFKGMKRQRGRNRGGGGGSSGGKPQAQNANRAFDSNGPEGIKVRGNAQHVFEKYQQLARDASAAGDRVLGENYLQHAEHYFRLLRAMQPTRPASEILGRDHFSSGFDIDFEDEGAQAQSEAADLAAAEAGETAESWQAREGGEQRPRDDNRPREAQRDVQRDPPRDFQRDERPRYENRDRNEAPRDSNGQGQQGQGRRDRPWRDERPRDERPRESSLLRESQPRDAQPRDAQRDDRPRETQIREDRPRYERNRDDRPERDPMPVIEPQAQPLVSQTTERPERAPRPARVERPARVLRDADGGESHAPAFLQAPAPRAEAPKLDAPRLDAEDAPRPKRRRSPRADTAASEAEDA